MPPTGTVTFLFTDVEGSTRSWQDHQEAMASALARHDEIVREAIESNGGFVFSTAGDAFAAAFDRAADAVTAAVEAQRALAGEDWPPPVTVPVRMGLHTGEAEERGGDYFGLAVNRAARVMDAGHGGQVLLSSVTAALAGAETLDLGERRLKGLDDPVRLHQVIADGLGADFPAVRSVDVAPTVPRPRTPFVGRHHELDRLRVLVRDHRLVTLTGAGGSGKTRLALETAHASDEAPADRSFFVDLGRISDERLVAPAVADALGLALGGSTPAAEEVHRFLAGRRAMVVMDNCEHVIDAAADLVDDLLRRCPELTVLATSREPLEVEGERTMRLPGLGPDEAVELFLGCAGDAVDRGDQAEVQVIADICDRLDGLPLAIELAAARTSLLSVSEIRGHLDDRFSLLTGGRRRTRGRHATLRATVEWSYDLLSDDERAALRAVSVMPGPFGSELAAGVLAKAEGQALDLLDGLIARSLLQASVGEADPHARYWLLETIRAFAAEELVESGEADAVRSRHADATTRLVVARHEGPFATVEQARFADDVLAALDWARSHDDPTLAVPLARVAADVLIARGAFDRAVEVLEWAAETDQPELKSEIHSLLAQIGIFGMRIDLALLHAELAIAAAPRSPSAAMAHGIRAVFTFTDTEASAADVAACLGIAAEVDETEPAVALSHWAAGTCALQQRDDDTAVALFGRGLSLCQNDTTTTFLEPALGVALCVAKRPDELRAWLASHRRFGVNGVLSRALWVAPDSAEAIALATLGRVDEARQVVARSWAALPDTTLPLVHAELLVALAVCAAAEDDGPRAEELLDGTFIVARMAHTAAVGDRLLADLRGVSAADYQTWVRDLYAQRLALASDRDLDEVARETVEAELGRSGFTAG